MPGGKHSKDPNAVNLGKKGGEQRAKDLTQKQRSAIARKAAKTRWSKKKGD